MKQHNGPVQQTWHPSKSQFPTIDAFRPTSLGN
jgi:hypothetical protein